MGQTQSSDYDEFTNGNDAIFSEGWLINNSTHWDPMIRGEGRIGWAHTNEENDQIATNRTADIKVPDYMKSGFLIHLPWSNCRDFDIWGILKSGQEVFIRRVNAYQNARNAEKEGYHDGTAIVPIPSVDRFTHIRIRGVRGRIHYMGMGWSTSITASGADSGFVSARNIMGSAIAVGYNNPVPQDWTGANFSRRDGRGTHFDWKDDQKNYIRGDTIVDNNMFFGDNVIMSGDNSWILHSPDDGRKGLYIVPGRNGDNWEWDKVTSIESDGSINTSGLTVKNGVLSLGDTKLSGNKDEWIRLLSDPNDLGSYNKGLAGKNLWARDRLWVANRDILSELDNLNSKIMSKDEILSFIKSNKEGFKPVNNLFSSKLRDNFCLDVAGASGDTGARIHMWDCHGGDNQRLTLDNQERLVFKHSGKCIDVAGASGDNLGKVHQWDCHDGNNQKWTYDNEGRLHPKHAPNKCLDIFGHNKSNGADVGIYDCNNENNQKWDIK
jgi:hypothetical protein